MAAITVSGLYQVFGRNPSRGVRDLKNGKTLEYCVRNTADVDEAIDIIYRQSVRVKQEELKNKASENA